MSTRQNSKGFTLVELLVVVVIVAILAGIGVYTYNKKIMESDATSMISNVNQKFYKELSSYFPKHNNFPGTSSSNSRDVTAVVNITVEPKLTTNDQSGTVEITYIGTRNSNRNISVSCSRSQNVIDTAYEGVDGSTNNII